MNQTPRLPALSLPEQVGDLVGVEVARSDQRPDGRNGAKAGARHELSPIHQPQRDIAGGIAPENVALAVTVEVAGSNDRPVGGDVPEARRPGCRRGTRCSCSRSWCRA